MNPCEFARERYVNIAKWRNLWSILVFAFGTTVVLFLVSAILLFINKVWLPGAVTSAGTIANGLAMSWVTTRRGEAVVEEKEAYEEVVARCGGSPNSPDALAAAKLAAKYKLF